MASWREVLAEELNNLGGAATDKGFWKDIARNALDVPHGAARGMSADLFGLPVDTVTNALNLGTAGAGFLTGKDTTPYLIDKPVGGSHWIGGEMEKAGILRPETGSAAETAGRLVGPLTLTPKNIAAVGTKTEQLGKMLAEGAAERMEGHMARMGGIQYAVPPEKLPSLPRTLEAPKRVNLPKRYQTGEKEGTIRGTEAFGGISPQKATAMLKSMVADAEEGAPFAKHWYDDASKANFRVAGEDPAKANRLVDAEAITSSGTSVDQNLLHAAKGFNQDLVGDPVRTGRFPNVMGPAIEKSFANESAATGLKRNPYSAGLRQAWEPNPDIRGTHDIHNVRGWGITDPLTGESWKKGIGPAGHRFLDEMDTRGVAKLNQIAALKGDAQDWTPYRFQSAAWPVQRVRGGNAKTLDDAGKHYGDYIDEYSTLVPREYEPGSNTRHLAESFNAPEAVRQRYADALENIYKGPQGVDRLATGMGALTDTSLPNRGIYEGRATPGYTSRILGGKETGTHQLDDASRRVAEAVAAGHGLLNQQKQVATSFIGGNAPIKSFDAALLNRGSPLAPEELTALAPRLNAAGLDIAQVDPRGARVFNWTDAGDAKRIEQAKFLREIGGELGGTTQFRENSGRLIPENAPEQWSSKPFIETLEAGGPKMVEGFNKTVSGPQGIAAQSLGVVENFAKQQGWTSAPYYRPMMEALRDGGLPALKDLVAKGIVPAATFAAITAGLQPETTE